MLAIIKSGGKQYKVVQGDKVKVEKIEGVEGDKVVFETLFLGDEKSADLNPKTKVEGKIVSQTKDDKVWGMKHKAKKRYKMKFGHKQLRTEVEITKIA